MVKFNFNDNDDSDESDIKKNEKEKINNSKITSGSKELTTDDFLKNNIFILNTIDAPKLDYENSILNSPMPIQFSKKNVSKKKIMFSGEDFEEILHDSNFNEQMRIIKKYDFPGILYKLGIIDAFNNNINNINNEYHILKKSTDEYKIILEDIVSTFTTKQKIVNNMCTARNYLFQRYVDDIFIISPFDYYDNRMSSLAIIYRRKLNNLQQTIKKNIDIDPIKTKIDPNGNIQYIYSFYNIRLLSIIEIDEYYRNNIPYTGDLYYFVKKEIYLNGFVNNEEISKLSHLYDGKYNNIAEILNNKKRIWIKQEDKHEFVLNLKKINNEFANNKEFNLNVYYSTKNIDEDGNLAALYIKYLLSCNNYPIQKINNKVETNSKIVSIFDTVNSFFNLSEY